MSNIFWYEYEIQVAVSVANILIMKSLQSNWNLIHEKFFIFADRSKNATIEFFPNIEVFSYLQFSYFIVKYTYFILIELWTRVTLVTRHIGESPFESKIIILTTDNTKKEWLAILDYMQYTWATDAIIISLFLQKDYYSY